MAVEVAATRRRFTRVEYHRIGEVGTATLTLHAFPDVGLTTTEVFA